MLFLVGFCYAITEEALTFDTGQEFKFRDMSDSHWAAPSVYKLVKLGITQGFPDGTFRGTRTITRYETALFLAKLADSLGYAAFEKVAAELKSEIMTILHSEETQVANQNFFGFFETNFMTSNNFINTSGSSAVKTSVINYRLSATYLIPKLSKLNSLKINFDSMDSAFYGNSQISFLQLIDLEGKYNFGPQSPLTLTAYYGPGPVRHLTGQNIFPSEYEKVYLRPYPGIKLSSKIFSNDIEVGYYAQNISVLTSDISGEVLTNRFSAKFSAPVKNMFLLNNGTLELGADYFYVNSNYSDLKNFKSSIILTSYPSKNVKWVSKLKVGSFHDIDKSKIVFFQNIDFQNLFNLDLDLALSIALVGSKCLVAPDETGQWSWLDLDVFDRLTKNGTRRFSYKLSKKITKLLSFSSRGSLDLSPSFKYGVGEENSRLTLEGGFVLNINNDSNLSILYRNENNPNSILPNSDLILISLVGRF